MSKSVLALEAVVGPVRAFIECVDTALRGCGVEAAGVYEMDHVCYRVESTAEYVAAKCSLESLGRVLVESMIGGRPIATILLDEPVAHAGYTVACVELPCPKPGRAHRRGLEHAELVVGTAADGCVDTAALRRFLGARPNLPFDTASLETKALNADASLAFDSDPAFRARGVADRVAVKFHQRPLYDVVRFEIDHGAVVPVPPDYFSQR